MIPSTLVTGAGEVWLRVWPVLVFLVLIKVAADLLDRAGLFDVGAHAVAGLARGRTWVMFALFVVLCVGCTAILSLDATAVLLTPVAITLARELDLDALPLAITCLWLANTASLTLPVSNLTNLIEQEASGWDSVTFVGHTWPVQVAAVLATVLVLAALFHRPLSGRYQIPGRVRIEDPVALAAALVSVSGFAVAVVTGVTPWLAALLLTLIVAVVLRLRGDAELASARGLIGAAPWRTAGFALVLFLVLDVASRVYSDHASAAVGDGQGFWGLLRIEVVGAAAANQVNNLPAYLFLEGSVHTDPATVALLAGVNAGPLILPWGSLATLLWIASCRERGLEIPLWRLAGYGLLVVPCVLLATAGALAATS